MNNRQKAKHFKKLYEEIKGKPIKCNIVRDNYYVTPIKCEKLLTYHDVDIPKEILMNELLNTMREELIKNMDVVAYPAPQDMGYKIEARINLARKN